MTRDPDRYYAGTAGAYTVTVTEWGRRKPLPNRLDLFNHSPDRVLLGLRRQRPGTTGARNPRRHR
jgi:hypothetical protein